MFLFLFFKPIDTPAKVPPVPTAQVNPSTFPDVCVHISFAVVSICALVFTMLSNWFPHTTPKLCFLDNSSAIFFDCFM